MKYAFLPITNPLNSSCVIVYSNYRALSLILNQKVFFLIKSLDTNKFTSHRQAKVFICLQVFHMFLGIIQNIPKF